MSSTLLALLYKKVFYSLEHKQCYNIVIIVNVMYYVVCGSRYRASVRMADRDNGDWSIIPPHQGTRLGVK